MSNVTRVTVIARDKDPLAGEVKRRQRRRRVDDLAMSERTVTQLRASLARAGRPIRARALARDLGLPSAEVTAELRRLQDAGVAISHDRRWAAIDTNAVPTGHEHS